MTKKEVLEAYSDVSEYWKERLKTKYSEYFQETVLEEGKIYTFENIIFQYYNNPIIYWSTKDFDHVSTFGQGYFERNSKYCKLVENESVIEQFLIAEAKRRGFKAGVKVDRSEFSYNDIITIGNDDFHYVSPRDLMLNHYYIFENGVWAKIIQE